MPLQHLLVLAVFTFSTVYGLQCYSCPDHKDLCYEPIPTDCLQSGNTLFEVIETVTDPMCVKVVGKLYSGLEYVHKFCAPKASEETCNTFTELLHMFDNETTQCYTCYTDLCNHSSKWKAPYTVLLVPMFIVCVYNFVNKVL